MALCIVTGVGPGVGTALVESFCDAGYDVAMLARSEERLEALKETLQAKHQSAHAYVCDVSDEAQVNEVATQILSERGTPDVVIHNAIAGRMGSFLEVPAEEFARNYQVNTMGLVYLAQTLMPSMMAAGRGMLMVTGSKYAHEASGRMVTFAVAKSSQRLFLESVAPELKESGIDTSYVIIDGVVDSESMRGYFPNEADDFFLQPDAIAQICLQKVQTPEQKEIWIS